MVAAIKREWLRFYRNEEGIGTLEMLLILAVLVLIAIAFRKWIFKWVNDLFKNADNGVKDQLNNGGIDTPSSSP